MSDAFRDRQKGFEGKYQMDQELAFKVQTRRDKYFGQWVAGLLGNSGADVDVYAKEVVASNFEKPGDDDMLGKVRTDLKNKGIGADDKVLLAELQKAEAAAVKDIFGDAKK